MNELKQRALNIQNKWPTRRIWQIKKGEARTEFRLFDRDANVSRGKLKEIEGEQRWRESTSADLSRDSDEKNNL